MLESRIMNRRTTVSAPAADLETLAAEARRRGQPLTALLAEAIEEKARALRVSRRPRFGVGESDGTSPGAAVLAVEPIAEPPY